jgi:serine protease Do
MEPEIHESADIFVSRRNSARRAGIITGIIVLNLIIALVGGAAGYAFLGSSSSFAKTLRTKLHISDSALSVTTNQNVKLEESSAVIDAAKKVSQAVVSITTSQQVTDFFGRTSNQEISGGTGFILTSDGLIMTNKHVVAQAGTYKVVLNDGRIFDAKIQATDPLNDIAVVKIDAKDLPTVELGSSDSLQIGQYVIAVGNALGEFQNSVTLGVVSAKDRKLTAENEALTDLIQTDAAINPGNSGGPLVNLSGQVVGIDTAIASNGTGGSIGVGFAISIDSIKTVIDSVRKTGEIVRPYLGVRYIPINAAVKQANNLSVDYGALVARGSTATELAVLPGSPADKAGILENDIILQINGERVDENNSLTKRMSKYNVGDSVTLHIQRKGAEMDVKVTLEKMPS